MKSNMRLWFLKRRYLEEVIDEQMSNISFNFSRKIEPKGKEEKGVLLIVTYHHSLNCLIIRENLYLLCMKPKLLLLSVGLLYMKTL